MSLYTFKQPIKMAALILTVSALLAATEISAWAQESRERGALVGSAASGPYVVTLRGLPEQPRVGTFNFTVTLETLDTGDLVQEAEVDVIAITPGGEREWLSPALPFPTNASSFVGNGEFESAGEWTMEVQARGSRGESLVQFPLEVEGLARGGGISAGIVFAVAISVIVLGAAWLVLRARRAQRRHTSRDTSS